jgi:hypothetical protein
VLKLRGVISPEFRWPDPQRKDDPRVILEAEGIRFDEYGRAAAEQRMSAVELAKAADMDIAADDVA